MNAPHVRDVWVSDWNTDMRATCSTLGCQLLGALEENITFFVE